MIRKRFTRRDLIKAFGPAALLLLPVALLISVQNAAGIDSDVYGLESLCQGPIL